MSFEQLLELQNKYGDLKAKWYRQLLTLAAGGFALLAGLGPAIPLGVGRYFLAGAWLFLGLGICFGAAAIYLEVERAGTLRDAFREELQKSLNKSGSQKMNGPVVANPRKFFSMAGPLMVASLLLAVVNLVSYSMLRALAG